MSPRIWELIEARLADDPELLARVRERHDATTVVPIALHVAMTYLRETGREAMILEALEQDLDRKDAGEAPLPDLGLSLPAEDMDAIAGRIVDRVIEETLGLRPPLEEELDELIERARAELENRDPDPGQ